MKKGEANVPVIVLSIFGLVTFAIVGIFVYSTFFGPNYDYRYQESAIESTEKLSQITQLSQSEKEALLNKQPAEEAVSQQATGPEIPSAEEEEESASPVEQETEAGATESEFERYLNSNEFLLDAINLVMEEIEAYNLHEPTLSNDLPKIEVHIDDVVFGVKIVDGDIVISSNSIADEDIRLITTTEELKKIVFAEDVIATIRNSFNSGKSNVEIVSGRIELMMKGYLDLYEKIYGTSITGSVIKMFS